MNNRKVRSSSINISDETEELYTKDTFKCGICNIEKGSIDDYVGHMLEEENCVLVIETSKYLKDLLLPRFKRKVDPKKYENAEEEKEKSLFAVEIEVSSGVTRWKCRVCGCTFSREAAVMNHYKLAEHVVPGIDSIFQTSATLKKVKMESKENTQEVVDVDENSSTLYVEDQDHKLPLNSIKMQNSNPICPICGQIFKSASIVASHIKIVHSQKRPFSCNIKDCNLSFKTKGSLVRHLRRHTGARPFICNHCGRSYRESGSLLRHQQSKIPCNLKSDSHMPRYGITLPFASGLKSDGETDCKIPLKKETAEEGDESGLPSTDLQEPEETKAKVRKEILNNQEFVPLSQDSFLTKLEKKPLLKDTKEETAASDGDDEDINKFELNCVNEEEERILRRYFMCPLCYKSYTKISYLSSHMKTHLAELGNECCTCKKRFTSDHALARHLLSHSSARQFECRQCGKAFKLKSHARNHLKSHSKTKTIPCPECGSLFKSVSSRNTHMKIHTQERKYVCDLCYKTFLVKASFLRHKNIHSKGSLHLDRKASTSKVKCEEVESKSLIKSDSPDEGQDILEEVNELSEGDSELDSFLNEKFDMSSIYSEQSELSFSPEDYLFPTY